MTFNDSQPIEESSPNQQQAVTEKKKRPRTDAQIQASRTNGAASTGPKSEATRDKVKFNAVKHGATSKSVFFLEGESREEFWAKVGRIVAEQGAQGELEYDAIVTAAYSRVTKLRAINGQVVAITENRSQIADEFHDKKWAEVRAVLPGLNEAPDLTVAKLTNSSAGCALLIQEFTSLEERLTTHPSLEVSEREHCLRLAGLRPEELFTDPLVRGFNRAYFGAIRGVGGYTIDEAANALQYDCPKGVTYDEFTRRMEPVVSHLPPIEEGHAFLKAFVRDQIAGLKDREELMNAREERQLAAAIGAAQAPCDRESEKRERYANQSDRTFNASVRLLLALKQERRKYGDQAEAGDDPAGPAEVENEVPPADFPGQTEDLQNEPGATQVIDAEAGNIATPAAAATLRPVAAPTTGDPGIEIIEKYGKEFDDLQQFDHLE